MHLDNLLACTMYIISVPEVRPKPGLEYRTKHCDTWTRPAGPGDLPATSSFPLTPPRPVLSRFRKGCALQSCFYIGSHFTCAKSEFYPLD